MVPDQLGHPSDEWAALVNGSTVRGRFRGHCSAPAEVVGVAAFLPGVGTRISGSPITVWHASKGTGPMDLVGHSAGS